MSSSEDSKLLVVKSARIHHAAALHRLFMQSVAEDFAYFSTAYRAMLEDQHTTWRFTRALASPESIFFVIRTPQGRAVGYNLMRRDSPTTAFLHWMYLHPDWRGQGHGRSLVVAALHKLEAQGVKHLRLVTHNKTTFYEQLGFTTISTVPIRLGGVDMNLMEYEIV